MLVETKDILAKMRTWTMQKLILEDEFCNGDEYGDHSKEYRAALDAELTRREVTPRRFTP